MTNENLMGASGVEFHGNNLRNVVTGSQKDDLIWLYGGNDQADGGAGNDILVGGGGNDTLSARTGGGDADVLYLGPGNNSADISDGDVNDRVILGSSVNFGVSGDNLDVELVDFPGPRGPDAP